jgi:hypothetical protein
MRMGQDHTPNPYVECQGHQLHNLARLQMTGCENAAVARNRFKRGDQFGFGFAGFIEYNDRGVRDDLGGNRGLRVGCMRAASGPARVKAEAMQP